MFWHDERHTSFDEMKTNRFEIDIEFYAKKNKYAAFLLLHKNVLILEKLHFDKTMFSLNAHYQYIFLLCKLLHIDLFFVQGEHKILKR